MAKPATQETPAHPAALERAARSRLPPGSVWLPSGAPPPGLSGVLGPVFRRTLWQHRPRRCRGLAVFSWAWAPGPRKIADRLRGSITPCVALNWRSALRGRIPNRLRPFRGLVPRSGDADYLPNGRLHSGPHRRAADGASYVGDGRTFLARHAVRHSREFAPSRLALWSQHARRLPGRFPASSRSARTLTRALASRFMGTVRLRDDPRRVLLFLGAGPLLIAALSRAGRAERATCAWATIGGGLSACSRSC